MLTDIEISQNTKLQKIKEVAKMVWINEDELELYWDLKAKIKDDLWQRVRTNKNWKIILVTAVNPTPAWEWKTTTTIGLGQAMWKIWQKSLICLREPSLWPVMWLKWWAAGGWYAQIAPMEDINLHFTGDFHAITSAHLLLSAAIDNHIYFWNELNIDLDKIIWKRAADVNDRALRNFSYSANGKWELTQKWWFMITTASEIMAILCLASDLDDLKTRLGNIIIAYSKNNEPIRARDLKIEWSMTVLLKDAMKPNIVQTLENTPCLVHGWPFANIAHWCNSLVATKLWLKLAPYVITEAWFWSDLWAQKFFDIKCRIWWLKPDLVVLVSTIRSMKYNWWIEVANLGQENLEALEKWFCNLEKHIENMKKYNIPLVVCLNRFWTDTSAEIEFVKNKVIELGAQFELGEWFMKGGEWMIDLANMVVNILENEKENNFKLLYDDNLDIKSKIEKIVTEIYWWDWVEYSQDASDSIKRLSELWFSKLPICVAKTPVSLSDDPKLLWRPTWFIVKIKEVRVSAWAWFIVAISWDVMIMPGLPKAPNAIKMDINSEWKIIWLN